MDTFKLFDEFQVKNSSAKSLSNYLTSKGIKFEEKVIKESTHIRCNSNGFQVEYIADQKGQYIFSLFIYLRNPKFTPYSRQFSLPYGISQQMDVKALVFLLGEPINKNKSIVQCIWTHLGFDITFVAKSWNDQCAKIEYICLYPLDKQIKSSICSVCHYGHLKNKQLTNENNTKHNQIKKKVQKGCTNCSNIFYCSKECKQKHYRLHRIYCQSVDIDDGK